MEKKELRKSLKIIRKEAFNDVGKQNRIRTNLKAWLCDCPFSSVGFYIPLNSEVDLRDVLADWLADSGSRSLSVPVIENDVMYFSNWTPNTPMIEGAFHTQWPAQTSPVIPEALLIPCVGYDAQNYRMGYGGGWYDRYLGSVSPRPFTVGIAFRDCRIESIAPEPYDIPLNRIITD